MTRTDRIRGVAQPVMKPHAQAAAALAQALSHCGIAAEESARTDGTACVRVISGSTVRLTEQVDVIVQDGTSYFSWSGTPLCQADDINTAADMVKHMLTSGSRLDAKHTGG